MKIFHEDHAMLMVIENYIFKRLNFFLCFQLKSHSWPFHLKVKNHEWWMPRTATKFNNVLYFLTLKK